jgi:hypothetical protein
MTTKDNLKTSTKEAQLGSGTSSTPATPVTCRRRMDGA